MISADMIYHIAEKAEKAILGLPDNSSSRPAITQVIENAIRDALMKAGHPTPSTSGVIG